MTAIGYVGDTVVPASQATDTVTFGKKDDEKAIVEAIMLAGDSNGPKKVVRALPGRQRGGCHGHPAVQDPWRQG